MSKILDGLVSAAESASGGWWMKLIPYALAVSIVGSGLYMAYHFGVVTEGKVRIAEVAQLNQQHQATLASLDKAHRDELQKMQAEEDAKEQKAAQRMASIDATHFKELKDANAKADAAIAAVRAGTLRVRKQFTCPAAMPSDPGASGAAAQVASSANLGDGTGARGLSEDDIAVVLRIGQRANGVAEKLKACQAILTADRVNDGVQP